MDRMMTTVVVWKRSDRKAAECDASSKSYTSAAVRGRGADDLILSLEPFGLLSRQL